jgi:hypothetical protein
MAGNVGEKQTADAPARATRNVIHVAAALRFAERLAVNPHVKPAQFDSAGSELAAAPNFHTLHVLRRRIRHGSIITAAPAYRRGKLHFGAVSWPAAEARRACRQNLNWESDVPSKVFSLGRRWLFHRGLWPDAVLLDILRS